MRGDADVEEVFGEEGRPGAFEETGIGQEAFGLTNAESGLLPNGTEVSPPPAFILFDLYNCLVLGFWVTDLSSPVLLTSTTQSSAVGLPGMTH